MMRYRVKVQGMTCTGCEKHVSVALENIGATNIGVNFQKGEAIFKLPDGVEPETAKKQLLIRNTNQVTWKKSKYKRKYDWVMRVIMITSSLVREPLHFHLLLKL